MSRSRPKPRLFLGSSRESLPVLEILAKALSTDVEVTTWHAKKGGIFALGGFTLESLVQSASLFDFALMVLGKDDAVISRGKELFAPRDNVVFELGLFMSQLGIGRTLVVSPRSPKLKVLSDLHGLNLAEYEVPKNPGRLSLALKDAIARIRRHIDDYGPRPPIQGTVRPGARDVLNVGETVEGILSQRLRQHEILNLALDMEITWPLVKYRILENGQAKSMRWRSLVINPDSPAIQAAGSSSISPNIASTRIREIREFCGEMQDSLRRRRIDFECRAYGALPVLHGFLINGKSLLLSCSGIENGKLVGAPAPYWLVDKGTDLVGDHFIGVFHGWFNHLWANSVPVWPT